MVSTRFPSVPKTLRICKLQAVDFVGVAQTGWAVSKSCFRNSQNSRVGGANSAFGQGQTVEKAISQQLLWAAFGTLVRIIGSLVLLCYKNPVTVEPQKGQPKSCRRR